MSQNNITYIVQAHDAFSKTLKKFSDLVKSSSDDMKKFNSVLEKLPTKGFSKINDELNKVNHSMEKVNNTTKKTHSTMSHLGESLKHTGHKLSGALTLPLVGSHFFGIKNVAEIEKHMKAVQANASLTNDEYERLLKIKTKISQETSMSPLKIAEGLEVLSASGVHEVNDLERIIKPALNLSRSSGGGIEETTRLLNELLHAYHLGAKSAEEISDKMSYAMDAAGIKVQDLVYTMQYVAPAAHQAGMSMDELTAFTMTFAGTGKKGSVAATSLGSFIQSMAKDPKKFKSMFDKMGLASVDANGHMIDSISILKGMKAMLDAATKQGKEPEFFKAMKFSIQEKDAWVTLLGSIEQFEKHLGNVGKKTGFAQQNAINKTDSMIGSFEKLGASVSRLSEKVFDKEFMESIRKVIDNITSLLTTIETKSPGFFKFIRMIATIGILLGPSLIGLGKLLLLFKLLGGAMGSGALVGGFTAIASSLGVFSAAAAAAATTIAPLYELVELGRTVIDEKGSLMNYFKELPSSISDSVSHYKELIEEYKKGVRMVYPNFASKLSFFQKSENKNESEIKLNVTLDKSLLVSQTKETSDNVYLNVSRNTGGLSNFGIPSPY